MRTTRRYLNPEQIEEPIAFRRSGVTVSALAEKFGYFDNRTVEQILQRHGVRSVGNTSAGLIRVQYQPGPNRAP